MKRMGFKSILSRFSPDAAGENSLEIKEQFQVITGRKEAEAVLKGPECSCNRNAADFASAVLPEEEGSAGEEQLSFSFDDAGGLKPDETEESEVLQRQVWGFVWERRRFYCIRTGKEISSKDLIREEKICGGSHPVWVLDLKAMLPVLELEDSAPVYDAGVAGHLLNPLKDTYDYDTLAKDYLSEDLPSRTDLL